MNPDKKTDLFHRRLYPLENDNLGITDKLFSERLKGKEER